MNEPLTMEHIHAAFMSPRPREVLFSVHPTHLRDHATALWLWLATEAAELDAAQSPEDNGARRKHD